MPPDQSLSYTKLAGIYSQSDEIIAAPAPHKFSEDSQVCGPRRSEHSALAQWLPGLGYLVEFGVQAERGLLGAAP